MDLSKPPQQHKGLAYYVQGIPSEQSGYRVKPQKVDGIMNGISTLDIIGIQKHLLGLQKFTSAYKVIAADINNSNSISALDIIALRKMILNTDSEMPNGNSSWRFVDAKYEFEDIYNPWGFPEEIAVELGEENLENDFIGIK